MKKVFYVIIGLIALYFILALFGPERVAAERSIFIHAPSGYVRDKVGDFRYFHEEWSPWTAKDPDMKVSFEGEAGQAGHHYAWEGNKDVGKGEMTVLGTSGDTLLQKLSFDGEADARAYVIVRDKDKGSEVSWGMVFDIPYIQRTPMLFIDLAEMIGADYEKGLSQLKAKIESSPEVSAPALQGS